MLMISPNDPRRSTLLEMLRHVVLHNRFYARKFGGRDINQLDQLPFTTKAELVADQVEHPPYGSNLSAMRSQYNRLHQTSGTSSGRPLRWLDTPASWRWLLECWTKSFPHLGLSPSDIFFFPFSFGPFLGFWTAFEAAAQAGYLCLPGGGLASTARLRFLMEHHATVVCCTPTYALHLAELAAKEGIDLAGSPVRLLIVAGEPGGSISSTRARIESVWGARVIDHYGMTEMGPVAIEPVNNPARLLVLESQYIAEVLDPGNATPVPHGQPGELVLTNLGRWGSPLIRYRTGDMVIAERDAEGHLFLVGGVLGRTDDMLHVRGNNLYPAAIEAVIRRFAEVAEFRLVVDRRGPLTDLRIEVEPTTHVHEAGLADAVARAIRDDLLFRVEVVAVPPGSLPRHEMKSRRVVTL